MAEDKKQEQAAITTEQMMQMIGMLQQAQPQQQQTSFSPVSSGWGQTQSGMLNFQQVMQSLESVFVELSMDTGNGSKANIFLQFPKEYGQNMQTLQALVNTLEANNVPVRMWRQSYNKGGR